MKNKVTDLIDLKSIITITLVITLVGIIFCNVKISDEAIKTLFVSVTSSVFTYYFTRKNQDNSPNIGKNNTEGE